VHLDSGVWAGKSRIQPRRRDANEVIISAEWSTWSEGMSRREMKSDSSRRRDDDDDINRSGGGSSRRDADDDMKILSNRVKTGGLPLSNYLKFKNILKSGIIISKVAPNLLKLWSDKAYTLFFALNMSKSPFAPFERHV
jgi:hypothetical protein